MRQKKIQNFMVFLSEWGGGGAGWLGRHSGLNKTKYILAERQGPL